MATNKSELEGMFVRVVRSAQLAGVDTTDWTLVHGSKTYGNSFKLVKVVEHGGHSHAVGEPFLGMTRGEAYSSLWAMARAFESLRP